MCEEHNHCLDRDLQILDFAKSIMRDLVSLRREYSSEFKTPAVQSLDETVENLVDLVLTASIRAKALYEAEDEDEDEDEDKPQGS